MKCPHWSQLAYLGEKRREIESREGDGKGIASSFHGWNAPGYLVGSKGSLMLQFAPMQARMLPTSSYEWGLRLLGNRNSELGIKANGLSERSKASQPSFFGVLGRMNNLNFPVSAHICSGPF